MHTFKDAINEDWTIQLDTTMTRQIRTVLSVDLLSLDEKSVSNLVLDDEKLVDVISLICTEQIKQRNLDEKGFAGRLVGEALDNACDALVAEVVFISRRNRSQVVAKAWEKTKEAEQKLTGKALDYLNSDRMNKLLEQEMEKLETQLGTS